MKRAAFCTLGCKVNQYETEAMAELFSSAGYETVPYDDFADVYVINTCSVTGMSDRKSRQIIRRAKKRNPDAVIIVCGCYAQTAPDEVLSIEGVNAVIGTRDRDKIVEISESQTSRSSYNGVRGIMSCRDYENLSVTRYTDRTRAFIKIQDGCSQFCSYCIIPYARGPIRSRAEKDVIAELKTLAENGFKEVILTGIHVASYGADTGTSLADLIGKIDEIDGIERVRMSSIEPMAIDASFIGAVSRSKKLCRHFHLSLQSGCDETLKRMNRKYTTAQYEGIVNGIRAAYPDAGITTDIMVGFPGETDEEFQKSLEFVRRMQFSDAHIFKYSKRRGTPAARRPDQTAPRTKESRSKLMIAETAKSREAFLSRLVGRTEPVLFERGKNGVYEGKTDNYAVVYAPSDTDVSGLILPVHITASGGASLTGEIIK